MDRHEENMAPACLYGGDPRVNVLLGPQKPPRGDERIRKSQFAYCLYDQGRYLIFNTLTRALWSLPPRCIGLMQDGRTYPADRLEDSAAAALYEARFLVPESAPEVQTYLELKDVLTLKEELPRGITQYVILPTTVCNARCFYCFEQGMRYHKMSRETVEDTLRFILKHKPAAEKTVKIHWFGGEPMCATDNIDRICEGLREAGIDYVAEMTSNGSLFTPELAQKASRDWHIKEIQITLDGMAEEYARRKNYHSSVKAPFDTVIRAMHHLIGAGIAVTVRLNADEDNLGEIYRVIDFISAEFTDAERAMMRVYAHSLFGQLSDGLSACPADAGSDALEQRVHEVNEVLRYRGLLPHDLGMLFTLKTHYCMVTAPECNVLIDAEGDLYACDAMPGSMRYGDVRSDIDPQAWARVTAPCPVEPSCAGCALLPQCTEFSRCPSRIAYDSCYKLEKRRLDDAIRHAAAAISAQQDAPKEAGDV